MSTAIEPRAELREALQHIEGALYPLDYFFADNGKEALALYQDEDVSYFISVRWEDGEVYTSSFMSRGFEGWDTGWEC